MKISIIIPVYNEEKMIGGCLDALINQNYPKDDYEIIVVNDGSTDNTKSQISNLKSQISTPEIRLINLEKNQGWITARETGAKNARYENLLFVDSRCVADGEILNNLAKINYQPVVGNVVIKKHRSIFDRFGALFRKKLYAEYFGENFKPVYITPDNYDDIPKGTTVLFCDKDLFLSSQPQNKNKWVSDDIRILKNIVEQKPLLKHPDIKVIYQSRNSFKSVFRHIFKRGTRFVDYYLNPK
ncbi:MAG: glycosyltransferase, partial [bacterium]|nr:glycosyltransferase [bacterium]